MTRINRIGFVDQNIKDAFEELKNRKFEEKKLFQFLERAFDDLKKDPFCGSRIQSNLWPKEYIKKYGINNLWKYDLPDGWRLIYTVKGNELEIISIIIEWFSHKIYEKKFKYNSR